MKRVKLFLVFTLCIIFSSIQLNAKQYSISICDSSKLEISVKPIGTAPFTYLWYHNTNSMSGETDSIYTKAVAIDVTDEGAYYCLITDNNGCTQYSDTINVTIEKQPRIVQNDFYLCQDMDTTLNLYNSFSGGTWSKASGVSSTIDANGKVTTNSADGIAKFYYTKNYTSCTCKDSVTITVIDKPTATITDDSLIVCEGNGTTITASGTSDAGTSPAYQWYTTASNKTTFLSNLGASSTQNTGNLSIAGTTADSLYYYAVIVSNTSSNGGCPTDTATAVVLVRVTPEVSIASVSPICEDGGAATLTATASSAAYQWYACTNSGSNVSSSLGTNSTLAINNLEIAGHTADSTFYYKVIAQNTNGINCPKDSATIGVTVYVTPTITISPDVTSICENGTINLSSTPSVTPITYQWYTTNAAGTTEESTLGTAGTQSFLTNVSGNSDTIVYFKVTVQHEGCPAVTSNIVKDTIRPRPELTSIPDQTICSGSGCTYTFSGNIPTGTTYTWVIGTDNANISGQANGSGSSFSTANLYNSSTSSNNSLIYTITPTSDKGCTAAANSPLTVIVQPSITSKIYVNGIEQH